MSIIENVHFYYGKIARPGFKYGSETEKEYVVDVLLPDKETVKWWKKTFKKQPVKEFDAEEFEEKFAVKPPFDAETYYVIKLKKPAQKRDGEPLPDVYVPKVFVEVDGGLAPTNKEFSNGAKGAAEYETFENDFGTFAKLKNIRLDDWQEYVREGGEQTSLGKVTHGSGLAKEPEFDDDITF